MLFVMAMCKRCRWDVVDTLLVVLLFFREIVDKFCLRDIVWGHLLSGRYLFGMCRR